jgi:hypothetical protein
VGSQAYTPTDVGLELTPPPTVPLYTLPVAFYSRSVRCNEAVLHEGRSFIQFCAKVLFWSLYLIKGGSKKFDQKRFSPS